MSTPFTPLDPDAQLGYLVARLAHQIERPWSTSLQAHGINPRQFSSLALLAHDSSLSQAELARRVMVSPQSMSESLSSLIAGALIERAPVEPGRPARLQVTTKGRKLLSKAYPLIEACNREIFDVLTKAERTTLLCLLRKLVG